MNWLHVNCCPECCRPIRTLDAPAIALLFLAAEAPVVCPGCGAVMRLDASGGFSPLHPAEIDELLEDQDWMKTVVPAVGNLHFPE